ncbi:hypothetical protein WOLCODRAFT_27291 [Wolfiporia cocos MD-104 SS10]|uniref:Cytochrome c oxidase subunit 8, mitochondrial n=1 Tax=Wolfiporia cocos (strain MD-104) TaxID=742152 RepID=A0A2H3IX49_WOLCO|nr:hypothetical protein WOLCODRAFT_27291 [Wolfiporia cocos MD-104 SS10]
MSLSSLRVVSLKRAVPRLPVGSVRFAHSDHGHHHHLPFQWKNRRAFAIKYTAFVTTGFMIPFIAVGYQLRKSQGSA